MHYVFLTLLLFSYPLKAKCFDRIVAGLQNYKEEFAVELQMRLQENEMKSMGGLVEERTRYSNGNLFIREIDEDSASHMRKVYEVLKAPIAKERKAETPALFHPDFADYLSQIHKYKYHLFIDLSIRGKLEGFEIEENRTLVISLDAKWYHFVHEFQHMLVDLYLEKFSGYDNFVKVASTAKPDADLLRIGLEWKELVSSAQSGLGYIAAQELCARNAAIKAGHDKAKADAYADKFLH